VEDEKLNEQRQKNVEIRERNDWGTTTSDYHEETATEVAPNINGRQGQLSGQRDANEETGGRVMGAIALALSLLALFYAPVLFGAAGIIVGFIARRRGASGLGNWAIGIGVVAMIIDLFIDPFF